MGIVLMLKSSSYDTIDQTLKAAILGLPIRYLETPRPMPSTLYIMQIIFPLSKSKNVNLKVPDNECP